jgi:ATP-dependent DNA helicase RecG
MTPDEIKDIIEHSQPEGLTLEYKYTLPPPSTVARTIAAFANSEGGRIIIGVNSNKPKLEVAGLSEDVPASAVIESALERIRPRPEINHYSVVVDKKRLYVVEVNKAANPVATENQNIFIRIGATVRLATLQQITALPKAKPPERLRQVFESLRHEDTNASEAKRLFSAI